MNNEEKNNAPSIPDGRETDNRQKKEEVNMTLAREEYQRQSDAFTAIETKASYLLIILAMLFAALTLSNLSFEINLVPIRIVHIILVSFIVILILMIFIFTIRTIISRDIDKYDLNYLDNAQQDPSYAFHSKRIMLSFKKYVKDNEKVLQKKHKYFKITCWLLIAAVIVFIADFLLIFIYSLI